MNHRTNNFSSIRLILTLFVLLAHAVELRDGDNHREPLIRVFHNGMTLGGLAVYGFFLLSGFLIAQSWDRTPELADYLRRRVLRIYPGFVVASILSLFVFGPLLTESIRHSEEIDFRRAAANLVLLRPPMVEGVAPGQPYPAVNGALWTIAYEFRCYLLLAMLGACGLLRRPRAWLGITAAAVLAATLPDEVIDALTLPGRRLVFGEMHAMARFAAFFLVGATFYVWRDRIRFDGRLVLLCVPIVVLAMYRPRLAELGLATAGAYLFFALAFAPSRLHAFGRKTDISYGVYLYGWPIQKLIYWNFPTISPWLGFAMTAGAALACGFLSWTFVERPFLALRSRGRNPSPLASAPSTLQADVPGLAGTTTRTTPAITATSIGVSPMISPSA